MLCVSLLQIVATNAHFTETKRRTPRDTLLWRSGNMDMLQAHIFSRTIGISALSFIPSTRHQPSPSFPVRPSHRPSNHILFPVEQDTVRGEMWRATAIKQAQTSRTGTRTIHTETGTCRSISTQEPVAKASIALSSSNKTNTHQRFIIIHSLYKRLSIVTPS